MYKYTRHTYIENIVQSHFIYRYIPMMVPGLKYVCFSVSKEIM